MWLHLNFATLLTVGGKVHQMTQKFASQSEKLVCKLLKTPKEKLSLEHKPAQYNIIGQYLPNMALLSEAALVKRYALETGNITLKLYLKKFQEILQ